MNNIYLVFYYGLISFHWNMKFGLMVGGQRGHHIRSAHSKVLYLHLNLIFNLIDICIFKALLFCISFVFGLICIRWNIKFGLVVSGQRGHHIGYVHIKESYLYMNLGLNFIDIYMLKAFLFCILFSHWTHFTLLEHEVWLGGGWPTRPPHTLCS